MNAPIEDGGSAFPQAPFVSLNGDVQTAGAYFANESGMTLRDYFAAKALPTLIEFKERLMEAKPEYTGADAELAVAIAAYLQADAMLVARRGDTK